MGDEGGRQCLNTSEDGQPESLECVKHEREGQATRMMTVGDEGG